MSRPTLVLLGALAVLSNARLEKMLWEEDARGNIIIPVADMPIFIPLKLITDTLTLNSIYEQQRRQG